ncbi:MAG: nucleotidyltransferase family protein [Clostridia bacterium]|nr:nucleotidyltransferase family protein [Clostridia bacterium]
MPTAYKTEELFLDALRCALHGERLQWTEPLSPTAFSRVFNLARTHAVLPLIAEAMCGCDSADGQKPSDSYYFKLAKKDTIVQASRSAEFLLLYRRLLVKGLHPAVIKGIVCRSLYPEPEQRRSTDEDLLVRHNELKLYHEALISDGFELVDPYEDLSKAFEVSYRDDSRGLYIEVHVCPFAPDSDAYGDCNALFDGALDRTVTIDIGGVSLRTLAPTDHLLYLLCHAYKHFLHGGIGIRQTADIGLFSAKYADEIDWEHVQKGCEQIRILQFAFALFRIAEKYLGLPCPPMFRSSEVDEEPLLNDILSGGLYGVEDINRAHSSTLTIDAVASGKTGKRRGGALRSVFLPADSLAGRFPYLRKRPWLLPVAWVQRGWRYLAERRIGKVRPSETLRIGKDRIALLRKYDIID